MIHIAAANSCCYVCIPDRKGGQVLRLIGDNLPAKFALVKIVLNLEKAEFMIVFCTLLCYEANPMF